MADQQEPSGFFRSITPTIGATLIVGGLSVIGALSVALINAYAQRTLEREQFESNLILKAIGSGDKKLSYDNLRFLVEGGLIRTESDKVSRLLQDTSFHFHLPVDKPVVKSAEPSSFLALQHTYRIPTFSGIVLDEATGQPLKGVAVFVRTNRLERRVAESQITGADGQFILHYPARHFSLNYNRLGYNDQSTQHDVGVYFKAPLIIRLKKLSVHQFLH
jgi:hypothetical protein